MEADFIYALTMADYVSPRKLDLFDGGSRNCFHLGLLLKTIDFPRTGMSHFHWFNRGTCLPDIAEPYIYEIEQPNISIFVISQ